MDESSRLPETNLAGAAVDRRLGRSSCFCLLPHLVARDLDNCISPGCPRAAYASRSCWFDLRDFYASEKA